MADLIKVNTVRLGNDTDKIRKCAEQIRQKIEQLAGYEKQLDGMWDGVGSEAFKASFYEDLGLLNTILDSIEQICVFEATAKTQYENCEKKVEGIISGLRG